MISVLLTVFIVGVGLLGLGQLTVISNQASRGAFFQSQADVLAYDMIDRMRANRLVAAAGNYDLAYGDADPAGVGRLSRAELDYVIALGSAPRNACTSPMTLARRPRCT